MTMTSRAAAPRATPSEEVVVTRAALRAASHLGLSNKALGRILGVSEASVSRMGSGTYTLARGSKSFDLAVLFLRLFRSLDAIVGGDDDTARAWLQSRNAALGDAPGALMQSVPGLVHVVGYLDARRALV